MDERDKMVSDGNDKNNKRNWMLPFVITKKAIIQRQISGVEELLK